MNREDVIRMYEKANGWSPEGWDKTVDELERFAALVAAETLKNSVMTDEGQRMRLTFDAEVIEMVKEAVGMEREACANVCENMSGPIEIYNPAYVHYIGCAKAIRARGQG